MAERLIAADLQAQLAGVALASRILVYEETTSTSDLAARLARDGAREGTVVFAERQTAGRGRQGRIWDSPARAGLWFSLVLRPDLPPATWTRFTTWAAVAVAEALQPRLAQPVQIRWPNDLLVDGQKLCGILLEACEFLIVGIGLNINQTTFPDNLRTPATSLRLATGHPLDRLEIAADLLRALDKNYATARENFPNLTERAWARSSLRDREVEIRGAPHPLIGVAEGLDETGALLIRDPRTGQLHPIHHGEVRPASERLPVPASPRLRAFPPTAALGLRETPPCAGNHPPCASSP